MESGRQRQFHIHDCLGRGGYGEVYRATMVAPGGVSLDVAVKLLRVDLDPGNEAVHRLRDEARLLASLRHPAILQVFDLAVLDGRIGLITEYVEGEDLSTLIEPGVEPLPLRTVVEVVATVAEALDAAWAYPGSEGSPLRLVHRDVKPSNVRISRHGEVKLLDFGIARSMAETSDREARTGTGSTVGSLAYMAPERFGRAPVGPAADVFGLGCTLYEAIAGARLFVDPVPVEMFRLAADPVAFGAHVAAAMAKLPPGLPPDLVALIREMLAYHAEIRPVPMAVRGRCEAVADLLPGEPLRRWVRDRVWRGPSVVSGYLEGKVLTEGTLSHHSPPTLTPSDMRSSETFRIELQTGEIPRPEKPAIAPAPPRSVLWATLGGAAAMLLALVLLALGSRLFPAAAEAPPPPAPIVVAPPLPVPVPVVVEPPPAPVAPVPVAPPPVPHHEPKPAPAPVPVVLPDPVAPLPVPKPVEYGTVMVVPDGVKVELNLDGVAHRAGKVPVGTYDVSADFGTGSQRMSLRVFVVPNGTTVIRCNTLKYTCDVDR